VVNPAFTMNSPSGVADGNDVYVSYYLAQPYTFPREMGIKVWAAQRMHDDYLTVSTIDSGDDEENTFVPACTGVIISAPKGISFPLIPCDATSTSIDGNIFSYPDASSAWWTNSTKGDGYYKIPGGEGHYVMGYKSGDAEPKFYLVTGSGLHVAADKPYIAAESVNNVNSTSGIRILFEDEDGTVTGIDGSLIGNGEAFGGENTVIYDLQGRRVTTPQKGGVYIMNGKKILVK